MGAPRIVVKRIVGQRQILEADMREGITVASAMNGERAEWVKVHPDRTREELARRSCLDMLMERFGIDAALVSVPKLAKAIGMSRSAIYASLKADKFFISHRMVGQSPMFTVDDVVSWYRGGQIKTNDSATRTAAAEPSPMPMSEKARRDRAVDDLVSKTVASLAAKQAKRGA